MRSKPKPPSDGGLEDIDLVNAERAAELLRVSRPPVEKAMKRGDVTTVPYEGKGGKRRLLLRRKDLDDVRTAIADRMVGAGKPHEAVGLKRRKV